MNIIESSHTQILNKALDAYSLRQKVTATNIANADTPGYKRHEVRFEDALREAEENGGAQGMKNTNPTILETDQNVVLENELIEQADTQYRFQLVTRALRHNFNLMRGAITGSSQF